MRIVLHLGRLAAIALGLALLVSCATPAPAPEAPPASQKSPIPIAEQETKSLARYGDILDMVANTPASAIAHQLREEYKRLIKDYPDSYFAEESYFRLMKSAITVPWPPDYDSAEMYYDEYTKNYPHPRLIVLMNDFMVRTYDNYKQWDRLVRFLQPYVKRYSETRNAEPLYFMYYYSEAKFALKDYEEARRGYQTVINVGPETHEASVSRERLIELDKAVKGDAK